MEDGLRHHGENDYRRDYHRARRGGRRIPAKRFVASFAKGRSRTKSPRYRKDSRRCRGIFEQRHFCEECGWVEKDRRRETPQGPVLYSTTKTFSLSLTDLPRGIAETGDDLSPIKSLSAAMPHQTSENRNEIN